MTSQTLGTKFLSLINKSQKCLPWFSLIISFLLIPYHFYKFYQAKHKEPGINSRQYKLIMAAKGILFSIIGLISTICLLFVATPIMMIVSSAKNFLENIFDLSVTIYNRFFLLSRIKPDKIIDNLKTEDCSSKQKEIKNDKQILKPMNNPLNKHQLNKQLFKGLQNSILGLIALIGSILQITPAAPLGTMMLIGVTLYSLSNELGFKPLHFIIKQFNSYYHQFFKPQQKTQHFLNKVLSHGKFNSNVNQIYAQLADNNPLKLKKLLLSIKNFNSDNIPLSFNKHQAKSELANNSDNLTTEVTHKILAI